MKLVKEFLNEEIVPNAEVPAGGQEVELNNLKNVLKNAQAALDILNTGAVLDPQEAAKLAVMDANMQDIKNRLENEATAIPGEELPGEGIPGDEVEIIEPAPVVDEVPPAEEPIVDAPAGPPVGDVLPEPFPEDEVAGDEEFDIVGDVNGDGEVNVLDVETKREGEEE